MTVALVAAGGALGALARYAIGGLVSEHVRGEFPWATFGINISGSFLLGLIFALLTDRYLNPSVRTGLTVGFLGAYTTFSTFSFETWRLFEDGAVALAIANAAGSVVVGLFAVYLGMAAGRAL